VVIVNDCGFQAEKELSEVSLQLESLNERLEEADGLSSAQVIIQQHILPVVFHTRNLLDHCKSPLTFYITPFCASAD